MGYAEDIRILAQTRINKSGLGDADVRQKITGVTKSTSDFVGDEDVAVLLKPPLTLDILTYDNSKDIEIEDTSAATWTLKTAATAKITDANGNELLIDTITFATS